MITTWTHPTTGEVVSLNAIEPLIHQWQTTPRESVRRMAWDQLHRIGVQLDEIVADLGRDLSRGYDILDIAPSDENEARWLEWLQQYEAACDAQSLITYSVVEQNPKLISHRRSPDRQEAA